MTFHYPRWNSVDRNGDGWAQVVAVNDGKESVAVNFIPNPAVALQMASAMNIERTVNGFTS